MTTERLSVRLCERSIPLNAAYSDDPASVTGSSWGASIPALHRVLANPSGNEEFPVPPVRPTDDDLFTHCDYWETALYLLTFLLGWSNPAAGLRWWYEAGRPTDDLRLAVLDRLWRFEGQLDLLAAWLLTGATTMGGRAVPPMSRWPEGSVPREEIEALARPFSASGKPVWRGFSPYGEDYNGLHLGHSNAAGSPHGEAGLLLMGSEADRRAVLVLESAPGWYSTGSTSWAPTYPTLVSGRGTWTSWCARLAGSGPSGRAARLASGSRGNTRSTCAGIRLDSTVR